MDVATSAVCAFFIFGVLVVDADPARNGLAMPPGSISNVESVCPIGVERI
jgi:hypothetical protein